MRKFRADEAGTATIESLFWVPIFVFFLVLVLDASFIFFGKAEALRVVQDGNRALSIRVLADESETEQFITDSLADFAPGTTVTTSIVNGIIITTALIPARELLVVGSIPIFQDTTISVTAKHFLEQ